MHPAIRIFGAFFLAIVFVSSVLYAIDHSHHPGDGKDARKSVANQAQPDNGPTAAATPAPAAANQASTMDIPPPRQLASTDTSSSGQAGAIVKCNIDGKIVYTDKGCPQGSKSKSLQITDNAVIPGYDRATVESALRQPPPPSAQAAPPAGGVIEPVTSITTEPSVDCRALVQRVEWLNNMMRRRYAPHMYDRLRRERDDLQTRIFWAHC